MRTRRILLWIGLLLFAASFFLYAVWDRTPLNRYRGFECATSALLLPWAEAGWEEIIHVPVPWFSIIISGWINPVFFIFLIFVLRKRNHRTISILRCIILLMIPFCWISFHYLPIYPREDHYLWIFAMVLVLFSAPFGRNAAPAT